MIKYDSFAGALTADGMIPRNYRRVATGTRRIHPRHLATALIFFAAVPVD